MNKKFFISILVGTVLVVSICSTIAYSKKNTSLQHKELLSKTVVTSTSKNNETTEKSKIPTKKIIDPNTVIVANNGTNNYTLIGNAVAKWISSTQFNYVNFNPNETKLTTTQLEKLKYNHSMLYYTFIYANGAYATHKNITAEELNKTAITVKKQVTGNWTPPTTGWIPSNSTTNNK